MDTQLKPCPFCGSDDTYTDNALGKRQVLCNSCEAAGPTGEDDDEAIAAWNRLAALAPSDAAQAPIAIELRAFVDSDSPDAHRVWLVSGPQQFPVGDARETKEEAMWYASMLRKALLAAPVASAADTDDVVTRLRRALYQIAHWPDGGNACGQEKIKRFAIGILDGDPPTVAPAAVESECTCSAKDMPFGRCCKVAAPAAPAPFDAMKHQVLLGYDESGDAVFGTNPVALQAAQKVAEKTQEVAASPAQPDERAACTMLGADACVYGPYGMNEETVCKFCGHAKGTPRASAPQATGLVEQHHRDSAELRSLCAARDEARRTSESLCDMLEDARDELRSIREALGVAYEPHQTLFERMLDAARASAPQATLTDEQRKASEGNRDPINGDPS